MVLLLCYLTRAVRRCDPTTVTQSEHAQFVEQMHTLMQRICNKADTYIESSDDESLEKLMPYEDKILVVKFRISSNYRYLEEAEKQILTAYRYESKAVQSDIYWLKIEHHPENNEDDNEEDITTYYHRVPMKTFLLGFMKSPVGFHSQFNYQVDLYPASQQVPKATLAVDRGKITIEFGVSKGQRHYKTNPGEISPTTEVYKLEIDFKDLSYNLLIHKAMDAVDLCVFTRTTLQLWRTQYNVKSMDEIDEQTCWVRACNIVSATKTASTYLNKYVLGGCNALTMRFTDDANTKSIIASLSEYAGFRCYHTNINYLPRMNLTAVAPCSPITGTNGDLINWLLAAIHSIGFRVKCQLKDADIEQKFMEQVNLFSTGSSDDRRHLENSLSKSYDLLLNDSEKFLHIDRVLSYFLKGRRELDELVSTGTRLVKRLIITPSRTLFMAPSLMHDNRILREFDADSAVICSFQNDDMSGFSGVANSMDFVEEAVGKVLRDGVRVANRHYVFLGCSGSQLRRNGCWLYAMDNEEKSAEDIRKWMGDLDHIRNVGTYLARMGQCFSDTTAAELDTDIDINWQDDDIEGGSDPDGKPYCFSDGVGRISLDCLNEVFMELEDANRSSAFQVRLGGSKGMLTLDQLLPGRTIMVRKSMFKFQSSHRTIEVMRRTQPTPLFLNYQIITILSQLEDGIGDRVFIRMLNNMLHRFADVLLDDSKAKVALSESGFSCCYGKLHKAGLSFTTDPFFKGVLKAITCARISGLKNKTRIEIPTEYGRAMLGVMDEVGVLNYGEVFVQYSADLRKPLKDLVVHEGEVVVSKMPCLHPGDVRKFTAVDHEELRHLVDCIVFPRKGPRPHPNEMAGSDLDGDEYFVTWMPDLIFGGPNHQPMDFPSFKKQQMDRPITVDDMVDFLVKYIVNDKVGRISNAHLAWADKESIHSDRCKVLARIFCHVIDFNKTGYLPPEVDGKKIIDLLPDEYPDFMNKEDHMETYHSEKVLGQMYRISKLVEAAVVTIDKEDTKKVNDGTNWKADKRFIIDGYEEFLPRAQSLYSLYADLLDAEQQRFGVETEEQLVSGCAVKFSGIVSGAEKKYALEKRLRHRMREIQKFIAGKFNEHVESSNEFGGGASKGKRKQLLAAACYNLTYRLNKKHRSFPWLFAEYLVEVLQSQNQFHDSPESPMVTLSRSINEINMDDVQRLFHSKDVEVPDDDDVARVYYVLINWGYKSRYLPEEEGLYSTLTVHQYIWLLDRIVAEDGDVAKCLEDGNSGAMLLAMFRAITNLDDNLVMDEVELPRAAVIEMKKAVIIGHHQVARDPRAQCLLVRLQSVIKRTIIVERNRWDKFQQKARSNELKKVFKQEFNVKTDYRRTRNGGQIFIHGLEQDVIGFSEAWQDEKI